VEKDYFLALANKNEIARLAKLLIERLFKEKCALTEEMQGEDVNVVAEYSDMKSQTDLESVLAKAVLISTAKQKKKSGQADKIFSLLKKEVSLYKAICTLTPNLKMFLGELTTIRPTSTQNERHFSTPRIFVTKQRSRLSDRAINASLVLKFNFENNNI
jgi:tetrahydrodipicolinate N-succinyltransferase